VGLHKEIVPKAAVAAGITALLGLPNTLAGRAPHNGRHRGRLAGSLTRSLRPRQMSTCVTSGVCPSAHGRSTRMWCMGTLSTLLQIRAAATAAFGTISLMKTTAATPFLAEEAPDIKPQIQLFKFLVQRDGHPQHFCLQEQKTDDAGVRLSLIGVSAAARGGTNGWRTSRGPRN